MIGGSIKCQMWLCQYNSATRPGDDGLCEAHKADQIVLLRLDDRQKIICKTCELSSAKLQAVVDGTVAINKNEEEK